MSEKAIDYLQSRYSLYSASKATVASKITKYNNLLKYAEKANLQEYVLFFKGLIEYLNDNHDNALLLLDASLGLNPNNIYTLNLLGLIYHDKGFYKKPLELYQKALSINPNFLYAIYNIGLLYHQFNWHKKAIEYLKKAIVLSKKDAEIWNELGNVYSNINNINDAIRCYSKAIELDSSYIYPLCNLGDIYRLDEDYDTAISYYTRAYGIDNKDKDVLVYLGNTYFAAGNYLESIKYYKNLLIIDENNSLAYLNIGLAYLSNNQLTESESAFKSALKLFEKEEDDYFVSMTNKYIISAKNKITKQEQIKKMINSADPAIQALKATLAFEKATLENQKKSLKFVEEKKLVKDEGVYIEILRRWNSYTPIIADNHNISKGGGYFLKVKNKGIVIDPGFNFIDNFKSAGHTFGEIDAIIISHAHNDHTADLESILTLLHKYNDEIKGLSDRTKTGTILNKLSIKNGIPIEDILEEDVEDEFSKSHRRKIVDIYLTKSTFVKYSGMLELATKNNYNIIIIDKGQRIRLFDTIYCNICYAKHNDILSDRDSVGIVFELNNAILIYTGDTGWCDKIPTEYANIVTKHKQKKIIIIAHLGGFKEYESDYLIKELSGKSYYKNHLGRLGLAKLCEKIMPYICFISEFGEELKEYRKELADIYNKIFKNKIKFIPADIGLRYFLEEDKIHGISGLNQDKSDVVLDKFKPHNVKCLLHKNDYSLHYYDRSKKICENDLLHILQSKFNRR